MATVANGWGFVSVKISKLSDRGWRRERDSEGEPVTYAVERAFYSNVLSRQDVARDGAR